MRKTGPPAELVGKAVRTLLVLFARTPCINWLTGNLIIITYISGKKSHDCSQTPMTSSAAQCVILGKRKGREFGGECRDDFQCLILQNPSCQMKRAGPRGQSVTRTRLGIFAKRLKPRT